MLKNSEGVGFRSGACFAFGCILAGLLLNGQTTGPVTGKYLMSFHACDSAATNCMDPRNHQVYLAQSNDGASWTLVPGWTPFAGSVPDVIRRGNKLYIYTARSEVVRYDLTANTREDAARVTINGVPDGFVDPSLILDDQGRLVLFFLYGQSGSDPAGCPTGQTTCQKRIGSATEVSGSDGSQFTLDSGDRAQVTISASGALRSASDPDIFFDGSKYILYLTHGPSISVWRAADLRATYSKIADLSNETGGIPSGHFDSTSQRYWTYAHIPRGAPPVAVIRRAVHTDFSRLLVESDWSTVISASSLGLSASTHTESPGFAVNASPAGPDLSLSKTASPEVILPGATLSYKITVSNKGSSTASGVKVTDPLTSTVSLVSASASQGSCSQSEATIVCTIGDLVAGASATVTIAVTPSSAGSLTNTASVAGSESELDSSNNSASVTSSVVEPQKLYFAQVADGGGFSTLFSIPNTGTTAVSGRLKFFNSNGSARSLSIGGVSGSQFNVTITAGGAVRLRTGNVGPALAGWAVFESTAALQGVGTFEFRQEGRLTTAAAVLGSKAVKKVSIPVEIDAATDTGVAIGNVGSASAVVRLRLRNDSGVEAAAILDPRLNPLPAQQHVADFVSAFFAQTAGISAFGGTLVVEVVGDGQITVTGLRLKEGLLSALPVIE
ncbi:MAG: DUF11 domain-containing protein [Acidobacteria bacterium]|nr:DUF11 domain-containing protein [Acidobacteriota bacterium]